MPVTVVDLNCDMGEGYGQWPVGDTDDAALMALISSANIATGFHAGDPNMMDATVRLATQYGVGMGAIPGYKDLQGFSLAQIRDRTRSSTISPIRSAPLRVARRHGANLQHVKPHGALYMELAINEALSRSFVNLMQTVAPNAFVFCMGISETYRVAREAGQPVIREFYADRDYDSSGSIVFTRHVGGQA